MAIAPGVKGLEASAAGSQFWITDCLDGVALLAAVIVATRKGLTPRLWRSPVEEGTVRVADSAKSDVAPE